MKNKLRWPPRTKGPKGEVRVLTMTEAERTTFGFDRTKVYAR